MTIANRLCTTRGKYVLWPNIVQNGGITTRNLVLCQKNIYLIISFELIDQYIHGDCSNQKFFATAILKPERHIVFVYGINLNKLDNYLPLSSASVLALNRYTNIIICILLQFSVAIYSSPFKLSSTLVFNFHLNGVFHIKPSPCSGS